MAQTGNGQKIFDYYADANISTLDFAYDWLEFFNAWGLGNEFYDWHKWCDEFAQYVIENQEDMIEIYGLDVEEANV
jgi:hypothetical protein